MNAFEPIAEDLYLLKIPFNGIWTGVYLARGEENLLIDSGLNEEGIARYLLPALRGMRLKLSDIDVLLNTHTHGDHIGGHAALKVLHPDIRVLTAEKCVRKLRDPLRYNMEIRRVFPQDSPPPSRHLKGVEADGVLADGASIGRLRLIETPGHDDDCCCFFDEQTGTLLTGDSLQQNGTDMQGMALYMDVDAYEHSIRKLRQLPVRRIVCGHPFNPLGAFAEGEACRAYLDRCLALTQEYEARIGVLTEKGLSMREVATELIRELNGLVPEKLFLALYTVREHQRRLSGDQK